VPTTHWDAVTLIGTLGVGGVTSMATIDGPLDGDAYVAYVEQVLVPVLRVGDVVMMDNLSVHKNAEAIALIERAGASVLFLPPYSPDYNPIEQVWSKLKGLVRAAKAHTRAALDRAVGEALPAITAENARAWFAYCGYSPDPVVALDPSG
jgi:transposase